MVVYQLNLEPVFEGDAALEMARLRPKASAEVRIVHGGAIGGVSKGPEDGKVSQIDMVLGFRVKVSGV